MRHFRFLFFAGVIFLAAVLTARIATAQVPLTLDQVIAVQALLARQGYDPGPADGRPGAKTTAAVRRYQQGHNLPVDGQLSPALLASLEGQAPAAKTAQAPSQGGVSTLGSLFGQALQHLGLSAHFGQGQGTSGYFQFGQNRGATGTNTYPRYESGSEPGAGSSAKPQSTMNFGQAGASRQQVSPGTPQASNPLPPGDYLNPQACRTADEKLDAYKQQHPGEDTATFERLVDQRQWACADAQQCRLRAGMLQTQAADRSRDQYAQEHFDAKPGFTASAGPREQEELRAFHQACDGVLGVPGSSPSRAEGH